MLLVDSTIESYEVISVVWQSTYFKISVNFDDVSPIKIIANFKLRLDHFWVIWRGHQWQGGISKPEGSQRHSRARKRHMLEFISLLQTLWCFTSISPEWRVCVKMGLSPLHSDACISCLKCQLDCLPTLPPPSFWSPRSCLLPQANLMMAGPQSQKRKNTCDQWKV